MDNLEDEIAEVERLLGLTARQFVRSRLVLLLSDLQQEKRRRELAITSLQLAATSALPALPGPRQGNGRPGNTQLDALRPVLQANLRNQAAGMGLPHHRNLLVESMQNLSGMPPSTTLEGFPSDPTLWALTPNQQASLPGRFNSADAALQQWMPSMPSLPSAASGSSLYGLGSMGSGNLNSLSEALAPGGAFGMQGAGTGTGLGGPLDAAWPFGFNAVGMPSAGAASEPFRVLTTCSWEQSDMMVKIYVPLRGVQTDMLRAVFTPTSLEVKVYDLHGKNYSFTLAPTFRPIAEEGCVAVASKTRKNILITIQKLHSFTPDERHWRDLCGDRAQAVMPA